MTTCSGSPGCAAVHARQPGQLPNYGFIVLGRIIEAVSGQSYYAYVEEHILHPVGMTGTGFEPETASVPKRASLTRSTMGNGSVKRSRCPGAACRPVVGTVADMVKFAEALQGGKLVSPALPQQATTAQNHKGWYGFGFVVQGEAGSISTATKAVRPDRTVPSWCCGAGA